MAGGQVQALERLVGVQAAVAPDMGNVSATLAERSCDPDAAMALGRVFLSAKDGHGAGFSLVQEAVEAALKLWNVRQALVGGEPILKSCDLAKLSSTELLPEKEVLEPGVCYDRLEVLAVELVRVARVRLRANVDQGGHAVLAEQLDQTLDRMIRVADRQDGLHVSYVSRLRLWTG
jgi:hypothetical protein